MEKAFRKTGIDIIGDAPWGTHLCQFYETREDLVDILVSYRARILEKMKMKTNAELTYYAIKNNFVD